jgi:virginiamycin B lyase
LLRFFSSSLSTRGASCSSAGSSLGVFFVLATVLAAQTAGPKYPAKTGVQQPQVEHAMAELKPIATFAVEGHPDWMAVTPTGVWVASSNVNHVVRLDAKTNLPAQVITVAQPCAGLAVGFGSLWIPSCGEHVVVRVDVATGRLQAKVPVGPADDEGGIAVGAGSVWMVASKEGDLVRIDPSTNAVQAHIRIPAGSFNPAFAHGFVWITSNAGGTLVRVDPATNKVVDETVVGPKPRFLTVGGGSVWVLNQGDGTIARVDVVTRKRTALIAAGIPGEGGEITFGDGAVWATVFGFPITCIDPKTNTVLGQWHGEGGDSIRFGHDSLWLTDLKGGKVWRLARPLGKGPHLASAHDKP